MSTTQWRGVWRAGPDAGASIALPIGRHLLGRAHTAALRCDDQALEPHHALVEVGADETVRLTQLTGRSPLRVDGHTIGGDAVVTDGAVIELAASTLVLVEGVAVSAQPSASVHDGGLVRAPRTVPVWHASDVAGPGEPPAREAGSGGLLPAVIGLVGAGVVALLLGQPLFLLFGALGATVAIGSWVGQRVAGSRRFRIATAAHESEVAAHEQAVKREHAAWRHHQLATVPTVARAVHALVERDASLWTRRAIHADAFLAAIGMNPVEPDVPVAADLGPGCRLALLGPHAGGVARSLIVQLVASCGPADLRITVVTDRPDRWDCVRLLPHLALPDGTAAVVTEADLMRVLADLGEHGAHGGHHLLVSDQPALLATRTSPLRRAISDARRDALIVVLPPTDPGGESAVPHVCNSVLTTASGSSARWVPDVARTMLPVPVRLVGVGERTTARCAAAIRGLVDPEDPLSVARGVPQQLSLVDLLQSRCGTALTPASIATRWLAAATDPTPRVAIGMAADGVVDIDLVRDGPHGLIAGTTGAGKSELLRSLVVGMAAETSPTYLTFVLIDYKGGSTFDACAALPHVVGMVTDLDDHLADRALRSLHAELRRRELLLRQHDASDLGELRAKAPSVLMPRLVVVIDEFAALVAEQPTFLHSLVGVAQRGRSLGVHLLLATQRPNGVITDDIRANTNLRLALRLQDTADAIDVVGIAAPAHLPRGVPGRAVLRLGADEHLTFQTARCTAPTPDGRDTELGVLVRAICDAARLAEVAVPAPPWRPALPSVLTCDGLGLVDDPDSQRTTPLRWSISDGRLAVVGSPGSGVTSTLLTLAQQTLAGDDADVYVIDARGDHRWTELTTHPRCIAVVQLHETERLGRLLRRVCEQVRTRRPDTSRTLLIVDGLDALHRSLDELETPVEFESFGGIVAEAEAKSDGVSIVAGAESAVALPLAFMNRCPARWILHLNDPHDAAVLGIPAKSVPPAIPGRIVMAGSALTAQLVEPRAAVLVETTATTTGTVATRPIVVVPSHVSAGLLPASLAGDAATSLQLGIEFSNGEPLALEVPDGEHLLLVGSARSGRSTGLTRIAVAWLQAHPNAWVGAVVRRRSSFAQEVATRCASDGVAIDALLDELSAHLASAADVPALLVVDDAESVDDSAGRLGQLAARGSGLCIAAAGRPDALRQSYGHWTGVVRRSRLGLVAAGGTDLDGDLLSVPLPRRAPVAARPGLWWVADGGPARLLQFAVDQEPSAAAIQPFGAAL